jgi:hypothetical protein
MDKIFGLFLFGILLGISIPIAEKDYQNSQLLDEPLTVIEQVFVSTSRVWHLAISVLLLITLPAAIFKSIRNRFSKRQFLPMPFMTGISFGFTFMALVGLIVTQIRD